MSNFKTDLEQMLQLFKDELNKQDSLSGLESMRVRFMGKKGPLTAALRSMGSLTAEERPRMGQLVNQIRSEMESLLEIKLSEVQSVEKQKRLSRETIDISMPGQIQKIGARHPLTRAIDEICEVFLNLGYKIEEGPEVELDRYNFELLRIPVGHPSRDTQDTFYMNENILLRTQTSPVQIRVMENQAPPLKIICPGKVYRSDALDATHSPIFHQIEGLVVDRGVTMGDLIGSLQLFARQIFGENTKIRLRPHHFPFTEPSCEVDITCWTCGGTGCRTCKGEGWIEVLGAGMVHPEVLSNCGIDPEEFSGFAFGIGVERTAMGRYGIDDIRSFYENDLRFLKQFR